MPQLTAHWADWQNQIAKLFSPIQTLGFTSQAIGFNPACRSFLSLVTRHLSLMVCSLWFAASPVLAAPSIASYEFLVSAIRQVRHETESRIEAAVEQEKVREAWETGKLIHEHILLNKDRAEYGKQVLERLASDLSTSERELNYMVEFAREYPIARPAAQLSWSHYQALLSINDKKERTRIEKEAEKGSWNRVRLREEIRKRNSSSPVTGHSSLPEVKPGPLYTYQIIRLQDHLKIDLGFGIYRDVMGEKFKEGDYVILEKGKLKKTDPAVLYTYSALVTQVVDGDTFHALIDLGFEMTMAQRIRLRRIDAPEIVSAEGKEAKAYLEKILKRDNGRILIQSRELDQHGRPIADVWVLNKSIDQEMLKENLAVRMID